MPGCVCVLARSAGLGQALGKEISGGGNGPHLSLPNSNFTDSK